MQLQRYELSIVRNDIFILIALVHSMNSRDAPVGRTSAWNKVVE